MLQQDEEERNVKNALYFTKTIILAVVPCVCVFVVWFVCGVCTVVCVCMFVVWFVCGSMYYTHTVLTSGLVCYALLCFWLSFLLFSLSFTVCSLTLQGYLCRAEAFLEMASHKDDQESKDRYLYALEILACATAT